MNKLEIEAFLAIVETKSFSKACEKLFVSQSTISSRLACLEEYLGNSLFIRGKGIKGVILSPKGKEFFGYANRYISLEKDIKIWSKSIAKYELKVSAPPSISSYVLLPLFNNIIEKKYPIVLNINSHWNEVTYNLVETHKIDIGLVSKYFKSQNTITIPLFYEEMVLITNENLSDIPEIIDPEILKTENEIFLNWGSEFQMWHDTHWSTSDFNPMNVDSPYFINYFLQNNNLWSIVPLNIAMKFKETSPIKISRFNCSIPKRTIYKILNRKSNPAAESSIRIFEQELEEFIKNNNYIHKII